MNEEIDYNGDVRLLDGNGKLLGLYNIYEARYYSFIITNPIYDIIIRKKAKELDVDLIMVNANIRPAICKAIPYRDDLYNKFMKEIINKDMNLCKF